MLTKRRKVIVLISVIIGILLLAVGGFFLAVHLSTPVIKITSMEERVEVFTEYKAKKVDASVKFLWLDIPLKTTADGRVNTKEVGIYNIRHTTSFFGKKAETIQNVIVEDTSAPEIVLYDQNIKIDFKGYPIEPDLIKVKFKATDNYDGDITSRVEKIIEKDNCFLSVTDTSGNETKKEVNLIIEDGVRPRLTVNAPSVVYVMAGSKYYGVNYSAKDNKDGDITHLVQVQGDVNTSKSGKYYQYFSVTDDAGNTTKHTQTIVVYGTNNIDTYKDVESNGKTVYLTFDDGPGAYTGRLLEYLDRYHVKATFFVTNQFSKYQGMIKTAHDKGHKIALHTKSHKWSIYSSVDSFMADFNGMQNIIKKQTGSETKIFRFPGGTNNAISRSYKKGIMTELANILTKSGYVYFDWNVDSYDSRSSTTTQTIISETISQIAKKKNAVVLMHDIHKKTVEAVPAVIEYCLQNGYTFKVLDENSPAVRYKPQN